MAKERNEIAENLHWDLTTIFKTDEAWEKELEELALAFNKAEAWAGHLLDSAQTLFEITKLELKLSQRLERLYVYASMKNDQDTRVAKYQEYQAKATGIYAQFAETFSFYEPEFLALTDEKYKEFVKEEPQLKQFAHFFERLFSKKAHILSQKEEKLLAAAGEIFEASAETFEIFDNADVKLPKVKNE